MTKIHINSCLKQINNIRGQQISIAKHSLIQFINKCQNLSFLSENQQDELFCSLQQLIKQQIDTSTQTSLLREDLSGQKISQIKQYKSSRLQSKSQKKSTSTLFLNQNSSSCVQIIGQFQQQQCIKKPQKLSLANVDKNSAIYHQIQQILKPINLTQQKWTQLLNRLKKDKVLKRNQDYQCLAQIIDQILTKCTIEIRQIKELLNVAKVDMLQNQLYSITTQYLTKLNVLANAHYIVRDKVQPKTKVIYQLIQNAQQQIKKYKMQCCKQINMKSLQTLQICTMNSIQMHKILCDQKQLHPPFQLKSSIRQILSLISNHLTTQTSHFKLSICHISTQFSQINPSQIKNQLGVIFGMLKFIRNINKQIQKYKECQQFVKKIQQILKDAEEMVKGIKLRINKIAKNQNVWYEELNFVLLACLTVLKEYQYYQKMYFIQQTSSLDNLQKQIQQKLLQPLQQMSKIQFKLNHYTFKRVLNNLRYLKKLNTELIRLNQLSQNFQFSIQFYNNQKIKLTLQRCFKFIEQQSSQLKFLHQLMNYNKQLYYCNEKDKSQIQKKKQQNFDKINLKKLQQAVQFVKCFQQVKLIALEFNNFCRIEQFLEHQIDKIDMKKAILQRIQQIKQLVNDQPQSRLLSQQDFYDLKKQYVSVLKILKHATGQQRETYDHTQIRNLINSRIIQS